MKNRKYNRLFVLSLLCFGIILTSTIDIDAQRRTRSRRAAQAAANAAVVKKGAEDVAIQIKNITKFVFVLGGVATGIEEIDKDVREGKATRAIERQNNEFKANVRASVRGIRAGLVKLEVDFRAKTQLRKYLPFLEGISARSARAEDLANAGRFRDSGKELLLVVESLADTLVEMP